MVEVRYYIAENGQNPFAGWFETLDPVARSKVAVAIARIKEGHTSAVKPIGSGVLEYKIDFGPGYRVYFGRDGNNVVILLIGGTKRRQARDIEMAIGLWASYKSRRKEN